jgi:hypothetical protein
MDWNSFPSAGCGITLRLLPAKKGKAMEDENRKLSVFDQGFDAGATTELIKKVAKAIATLSGPPQKSSVNGLALPFDQEELCGKSRMSLP